LTCQILANIRK